jgi:imidazolonepropionase
MEVKSGYGLTIERERRMLRLYRLVQEASPIPLSVTFLAHMLPPEYAQRRSSYCDAVVDFIAEIAETKMASAVDVFVEQIAFTVAEAETILATARSQGLRRSLHADQLRDFGGADLAARVGATSADHLEHASDSGLAAMAEAGVVGVILPFASWNLRQPPTTGGALRDHGVSIAIATDFNPGSAPSLHLPLAMAHAVIDSDLTPTEAFQGVTRNAARVLRCNSSKGSLTPGMDADIVVLAAESVDQWLYHIQPNAARVVVAQGKVLW